MTMLRFLQKFMALALSLLLLGSLVACGVQSVDPAHDDEPPASSQENNENPADESTAPADGEGEDTPDESEGVPEEAIADSVKVENVDTTEETEALMASPPAVPMSVTVSAPGVLIEENESAIIDYSNTAYGYVMVKYTGDTSARLKAQVVGPTTKYTYNLTAGRWAAFPLSDGNGSYQVTIYQNVVDTKYAAVLGASFYASMNNEFEPFLHSNQYVNYDAAPNTVAMAAYLTGSIDDALGKVEAVYDYVVRYVSYDTALASSVTSGYLPVLDNVLASGKGICFDYAALMTGMLRSQGVPCKLVVGYAGSAYHAWISVWSAETGWVDGAVFFDGWRWHRMDPTYASTSGKDPSVMDFIGNSANYTTKYIY